MKLVPIDKVYPSAYNPRITDPQRLALISLSLRKLGFLLPLYADANGELLSGHQRHLCAMRLGLTHVPVEHTRPMDLEQRQATNVVFNRATNDMDRDTTPKSLVEALERSDVYTLADALPDKSGDGFYPCLNAKEIPIGKLTKVNAGRWVSYAASISKTLARKGVLMPVVCTPDLWVVNGLGRLQYAAEKNLPTIRVVIVSEQETALADAMLNLLSMDFDIHNRYADILRYNSFRRARLTRPVGHISANFIWALLSKRIAAKSYNVTKPENRAKWIKFYGKSILDFGAGRMTDVATLRGLGVDASAFEPFCLQPESDEIDYGLSVEVAGRFLDEVAAGKQWTSIFLTAVLNSVPFEQDRRYVLAIVSALCSPVTHVYALTQYADGDSFRSISGKSQDLYKTAQSSIRFLLDYEKNVTLGEFGGKPKMQKYFERDEFIGYLTPHWQNLRVTTTFASSIAAECWSTKPHALGLLKAAIQHEFDLPYPDGRRMGLARQAIAAFSERLGIDLAKGD